MDNTLLLLTSAALLLPGITSKVVAETAPDNATIGYRFSNYGEDDLAADDSVSGNSSERYHINVHQFRLMTPIAENYSVAVDIQYETMSGASPWFVDNVNSNKLVAMSGASIEDTRTDFSVHTRQYREDGSAGATIALSEEDDYSSTSFSLDGEIDINDKQTTLSGGGSYSSDSLEPTVGATPTNTLKADKNSTSLFVGINQIVNARTMFRLGLNVTNLSGFLSEPYKANDRRPDSRQQLALTSGVRVYIQQIETALHIDYRYYHDDWGVTSHTLTTAWYKILNEQFTVVPRLRLYSQKQASFFINDEDSNGEFHSSDYRLSTYGAIGLGIKLIAHFEQWDVIVSVEDYTSTSGFNLFESDDTSPSLVDYTRMTLGFDFSF